MPASRLPLRLLGGFDLLLGLLLAGAAAVQIVVTSNPDMDIVYGGSKAWLGAAILLLLGLGLGSLGYGVLRCQRWARTLGAVLGKAWLAVGLLGCAFIALNAQALWAAIGGPRAAIGEPLPWSFAIVPLTMVLVAYVILPGLQVWVLARAQAVQICREADPEESWTDAHPEPVLLMLLVALLGLMGSVVMMLSRDPKPLFGAIFVGHQAQMLQLILAAFFVWLLRATWQHRGAAWTATVVYLILQTASVALSLRSGALERYYRSREHGEEMLKAYWGSAFGTSFSQYLLLPLLAYGIYVWKCRNHFAE